MLAAVGVVGGYYVGLAVWLTVLGAVEGVG